MYCLYQYNENGTSDPASVRNNDLFGCSTALYYSESDGGIIIMLGVNGAGNLTENADDTGMVLSSPPASGNVSADPIFMDQGGGDWHFSGSSPASVTAGGLNGIDDGG